MTRLSSALRVVGTVAVLLGRFAAAQVTTECQPLNTTGCPADPAFGTDYTFNFNTTPSASFWETTAGTVDYSADNGAAFVINKQGDSPTIRSKFYIFFGRTELFIKVASGTGIISSVMFLSDDLDEIDWEFMGGNASFVETNYFGKGRQDYRNALYYPVAGGAENDFHNYTTVWTNASLDYYVDGAKVRTLLPKDANNTDNYPQTPVRISMGIWAGGDPSLPNGTREWAGGTTDYTQGPFSMFVRSARVTDYSSGKEYSYGDHSGSWTSIKIASGNSTALDVINTKPAESLSDKWKHLSPAAHTAVYAASGAVGAILLSLGLYYCIKQRRRGAEENRLYEARLAQERMELEQYKKAGIDPDSLTVANTEYNAHDMGGGAVYGKSAHDVAQSTDSLADEKAWGAAAGAGAGAGAGAIGAAAGGQRSPMPLLQNGGGGLQSPPLCVQSPGPLRSPARSPSPGTYAGYGVPVGGGGANASAAARSFSAPNAQMRASPGPDMARSQSPSFRAPSAGPQRSFTGSAGWGGSGNAGYSNLESGHGGPVYNGYTGGPGSNGYGGNNYSRGY